MSNITIREVYHTAVPDQIRTKLTPSQEAIISVSIASEVNPMVKDMNGETMENLVTAIGVRVALMLGQKASDEDEQEEINRELNRQILKFKHLTFGEIMKALENGLEGQYLQKDSFVYFTPANFVQWVRAYESETKLPVKKKLARLQQDVKEDPVVLSEIQSLTHSWNFFTWVIKKYLAERHYEDKGDVVYNFLTKIDFLVVSEQERENAVRITNARLLEEVKDNPRGKQKVVNLITGATGESETIDSLVKQTIVSERLKDFYNLSHEDQYDYMEAVIEKLNIAQEKCRVDE